MVDPHAVQDGGLEVVDVHRLFHRVVTQVVGGSDGDPGLDAPTRHPDGVGLHMVVPAVVSPGHVSLVHGRSPELPAPDHQGILE